MCGHRKHGSDGASLSTFAPAPFLIPVREGDAPNCLLLMGELAMCRKLQRHAKGHVQLKWMHSFFQAKRIEIEGSGGKRVSLLTAGS